MKRQSIKARLMDKNKYDKKNFFKYLNQHKEEDRQIEQLKKAIEFGK